MRTFLRLLLFSAPVLIPSSVAQAAPPNVVMIIADDQAWTDFGFMGHPTIRTPHLDRLAAQSATFPQGYVPSSLCRPSLATIISGLYPHQHQITGNDPPQGADRQAMLKHIRQIPTLPRLLAANGYVSLQTSKWWEGAPALGGFTAAMTHGDPQRGGRHGDDGLTIGRQGLQPIFDFIDQAGDQPFFVWYAPLLPHSPHNPPPPLLEKYTAPGKSIHVARYQAMCEWFDQTCGQLLDRLDENDLAENTLVVFVTDNGWIQDRHSRKYAPKSKRSPYDGGVRTPILLRWPGRIAPVRHETLISSIDLAPTILAACGLEPPEEMLGLNLLDVVAAQGRSERTRLFGEIFEHDVADLAHPTKSLLYRWCRDDRWKLILPTDPTQPPELYDLAADPFETRNLAPVQPDRAATLAAAVNEWWPAE